MKRNEQKFHLIGVGVAILLHAGLSAWLLLIPHSPRKRTVVEVEIRKPPPPPPVLQPSPPPSEPERQLVRKVQRPPEAPRPNRRPPPAEPPRPVVPVFGLSKDDTVDKSSISVPLGNTTMADPMNRPKVAPVPLPAVAVPAGNTYHPLSEADLRSPPGHDADGCFAGIKDQYSASDAYSLGIEGPVVFRIELDERGKIRGIRKLKGIGHGIDEMAMGWLRSNPDCKFTPAVGKDGKPGAFVIERYSITFQIER